MKEITIELRHIAKSFGQLHALKDVSLAVKASEFMTLLGPSGCGKTTLLRIITGYLQPDAGSVIVDGTDITQVPTHKRNMGMVFQSFALFPHLSVYENVAFPLKIRRMPLDEQKKLVDDALRIVHLETHASAFPRQLSGGQQQRVGLARAIVFRPSLLLLDEPLSNLDANLREEMRTEINHVTRRLGIAAIYVTHDQQEALALSDRIAVLNHGKIVQVGTPVEIYNKPRSRFVADFIGHSNSFTVQAKDGSARIDGVKGELTSEGFKGLTGAVNVFIHPGDILLSGDVTADGRNQLECQVVDAVFLGDRVEYMLELTPGLRLKVHSVLGSGVFSPGSHISAMFPADKLVVVEKDQDD
jgi:ABC-type Fe3+/spermidine/putrescine transport system ATPase subunit